MYTSLPTDAGMGRGRAVEPPSESEHRRWSAGARSCVRRTSEYGTNFLNYPYDNGMKSMPKTRGTDAMAQSRTVFSLSLVAAIALVAVVAGVVVGRATSSGSATGGGGGSGGAAS